MKLYDKTKNFNSLLEVKALTEPVIKLFVTELSEILRLIQQAKDNGLLDSGFSQQFIVKLKELQASMQQRNINEHLTQNECIDMAYALEDIICGLRRVMKIE